MIKSKLKKAFSRGVESNSYSDFKSYYNEKFEPEAYKLVSKKLKENEYKKLAQIYSGFISNGNNIRKDRMLNSISALFKSIFSITLTDEQVHKIYLKRLEILNMSPEFIKENYGESK